MSGEIKKEVAPPHLASISLLDRIRPKAGWRTERAVLSTYSANSAVIVAALLALAGQESETGSGSRIGLAKALLRLRGTVRVVLQAGQLALPRRPAKILALLDRFVVQVSYDQGSEGLFNGISWHPKFALVQHVHEERGEARWIFMLGSRNLTRDTSWDLSLALESTAGDTTGQIIPGISAIAEQLADVDKALRSWSGHAKDLSRVYWSVPQGLSVEEVRLMLPNETDRQLPAAPTDTTSLLAVSPFLDGTVISELSAWCADTRLLSVRASLRELAAQAKAPLAGWSALKVMSEPDWESDDDEQTKEGEDPKMLELANRGLHAKFLYAEHPGGPTLWLGSANLTARAWQRNAEIVARIRVIDPAADAAKALIDGIRRFADDATSIELEELEGQDPVDADREALDAAGLQVSARLESARQQQVSGTVRVVCEKPPHPDDARVEFLIGRVGETLIPWQRGTTSCELTPLSTADSVESSLLHIALRLSDVSDGWLHMVPWDPPLDEDRDDHALRQYLGARQTLLWIRETLLDVPAGDDGGPWDGERNRNPKRPPGGRGLELPSIESFLRIWIKDSTGLSNTRAREIDRILVMAAAIGASGYGPADRDDLDHLNDFKKAWKTVRKGLAGIVRNGR